MCVLCVVACVAITCQYIWRVRQAGNRADWTRKSDDGPEQARVMIDATRPRHSGELPRDVHYEEETMESPAEIQQPV